MREYTVTYTMTDEQEARLMALTMRFNRAMNTALTAEGMLHSLLNTGGSAADIDERMKGVSAALAAMEKARGGEGDG